MTSTSVVSGFSSKGDHNHHKERLPGWNEFAINTKWSNEDCPRCQPRRSKTFTNTIYASWRWRRRRRQFDFIRWGGLLWSIPRSWCSLKLLSVRRRIIAGGDKDCDQNVVSIAIKSLVLLSYILAVFQLERMIIWGVDPRPLLPSIDKTEAIRLNETMNFASSSVTPDSSFAMVIVIDAKRLLISPSVRRFCIWWKWASMTGSG